MNKQKQSTSRTFSPWTWIPTLYFAEGIPYVVVMTVAVIMYKRLGISNTDIALYTGLLYLPWVIKPFWSPFVDLIRTKRWWIITMQLILGAGLAGVAFLIPAPFFFQATLAVMWLIAFSSATHDIAADGFYMLALNSSQQSFFVGIRSTFYRLAMITGQGILIILAGFLETSTGLEPLELNVNSTKKIVQTDIWKNAATAELSNSSEAVFTAFPSMLEIQTATISPDSLQKIKDFAAGENLKNGFVQTEKKIEKKKNWWQRHVGAQWTNLVSEPLGNFISRNFGKKTGEQVSASGKVGNAAIVAVKLNKKPEAGKETILNTRLSSGDKSIALIGGERL
ncbi:MAG TPA: MFS transporter, partial [Paludibacteraceae bacterium]|nr:MFS transporter [Paludibacteraceae bacterium]HPT43115.1 MFS transporter [Paludibacteraceae bacterium]